MREVLIFAVDRIEGSFAVLESGDGGQTFNVPLESLPRGIRQGNVLRRGCDGTYSLDPEEEERRRAENFSLQESLFDS
jgi:hypothetical protein